MSTIDRVERAKNAAAVAALEAYTSKLEELLGCPASVILMLNGTRHIHEALAVDPVSGKMLGLRVEWAFTTDEKVIAAMAERARGATS